MTELVSSISLRYRAGDDLVLEFAVTIDDVAVNISGMTPRFVTRRNADVDPVISTEVSPTTATATVTDGAGGIFQVAVDKSVTALLSGTYRWQAELEDASNDVQTVARGYITLEPNLV